MPPPGYLNAFNKAKEAREKILKGEHFENVVMDIPKTFCQRP